VRPERSDIETALNQFIGVIEQVPPIFSAVKIGGQRAYALARENREVELSARKVRIDRFILLGQTDADHADFEVASGKGAYMRSLARDLALALGTVGHIALLRRLRVGPFNEDNAISLDKLAELVHSPAAPSPVLPVETVLDDIPALALTEADALRLHNGQAVSLLRMARDALPPVISPGMIVRAMAGQRLVAVACIESGELRPVRVMNL
jgi:tRNA pseudouridine55 synthase